MLLALTWWSILLNKKNTEAFIAKAEIIKLEQEMTFGIREYDLSQNETYLDLEDKFKKQQYMILGESIVFTVILIAGIYLIYRSYSRELEASHKQQNFLLSITHELKSPLAGIGLVLDTMSKRALSPEQLRQLTDTGKHEKKRLAKLIDNLLMAAKIEDAYTFNMEDSNLSTLLDDMIDQYQSLHPDILFHRAYPIEILLKMDREAVKTVISNLFSNALKYKSKDIPLEITVTYETIGKVPTLSIADNGIGIEEGEKAKIFDKFYRIGSEYTRKTQGTGLGLYIVKKIIQKHKGAIKVKDVKPHGTSFVISWKA
jgi:two-component system phosphate regulon sensor histidine kinase PhoR